MMIPVRANDPKNKRRRFVKGAPYIRTHHNEIIYFDLGKWRTDPKDALVSDGHGGSILDIDLENIPE